MPKGLTDDFHFNILSFRKVARGFQCGWRGFHSCRLLLVFGSKETSKETGIASAIHLGDWGTTGPSRCASLWKRLATPGVNLDRLGGVVSFVDNRHGLKWGS